MPEKNNHIPDLLSLAVGAVLALAVALFVSNPSRITLPQVVLGLTILGASGTFVVGFLRYQGFHATKLRLARCLLISAMVVTVGCSVVVVWFEAMVLGVVSGLFITVGMWASVFMIEVGLWPRSLIRN